MISWTIEAALGSECRDRVVVSTDDEEIAGVSRDAGAEVPFMRPKFLAQDTTGHMDVVVHAVEWLVEREQYEPEYVMLLQPTSPLRNAEDVDAAWRVAIERKANSVISVCETHQHPHLVRRISDDGTLVDFVSGSRAPGSSERRRQDMPPAYFENGAIYLTRRNDLLVQRTFCPVRTYPYVMPRDRSLQIDDAWDFELVEWIVSHGTETGQNGKSERRATDQKGER